MSGDRDDYFVAESPLPFQEDNKDSELKVYDNPVLKTLDPPWISEKDKCSNQSASKEEVDENQPTFGPPLSTETSSVRSEPKEGNPLKKRGAPKRKPESWPKGKWDQLRVYPGKKIVLRQVTQK